MTYILGWYCVLMSTGESLEVHIFVICVVKYVKVLGNEAHGLLYILHKSNYHYIYNKQFSGGAISGKN